MMRVTGLVTRFRFKYGGPHFAVTICAAKTPTISESRSSGFRVASEANGTPGGREGRHQARLL